MVDLTVTKMLSQEFKDIWEIELCILYTPRTSDWELPFLFRKGSSEGGGGSSDTAMRYIGGKKTQHRFDGKEPEGQFNSSCSQMVGKKR